MSDDKAIIDRQAAQIAMLREALQGIYDLPSQCSCEVSDTVISAYDKARAALTATAADVEAWEKLKRDAVLEEAAAECARMTTYGPAGYYAHQNVERAAAAIRAMKETP